MNYKEIIRSLEERREEMVGLLTDRRSDLELEKQHQIYGAVTELTLVLKALNYWRENNVSRENHEIPNIEENHKLNKSKLMDLIDK